MTLDLFAKPVIAPVPGPVLVIGLNPSTATATQDDPTIAKLARYVRSWGVEFSEPPVKYREGAAGRRRYYLTRPGMVMTNLFSLRSTDPRGLLEERDEAIVSEKADVHFILVAAKRCGTVLCAWGGPYGPKALGELVAARAQSIVTALLADGHALHVLALTKDGIPRHPLYLKGDLRPTIWRTP